ncbi:hypothetical protein K2173_011183 [Erythroxylum novogranatense]|uniref:Protein kinase domain-containing protein n=1 Tax=Erythroxylum novogranatense TaxID=1862640 RepID=A0AAV8TUD1_9ROSI|nr:hypothetical protein K2173_011183 [Erythroxylum novogranatense]
MGCTHGKHPVDSPARGLEKLKMDSGYFEKEQVLAHQSYPFTMQHSNPKKLPSQRYANGFSSGGSGRETTLSDGKTVSDGHCRERRYTSRSSSGNSAPSGERKSRRFKDFGSEEVVDGWPKWLVDNVPKKILEGLIPKSAENYDKLDKIGQGTYSNVYKARDKATGKIVALKKVRLEISEPESIKFMAREIIMLQKLDHPNVVKLEGLATSRLQYSLYLVFDFMRTDLATIISHPEFRLTESQVKCYMHQLLSGLQHCHDRGILHRDIKGSNLLIDKNGRLKIADFGLANYFPPKLKRPLTSRVVTLWYRAPELILGATDYGVGIDLWSTGCLMAEMFSSKPLMPGRTEVEQLHRIFKLCGTPSEDYWKHLKLSNTFRPPRTYKPSLFEAFSQLPESSLGLLTTLLSLDPTRRGSAALALQDDFFYTKPLACNLSDLPVVWKEEDELTLASEQRKDRSPKLGGRSRTYREHGTRDVLDKKTNEEVRHSNAEVLPLTTSFQDELTTFLGCKVGQPFTCCGITAWKNRENSFIGKGQMDKFLIYVLSVSQIVIVHPSPLCKCVINCCKVQLQPPATVLCHFSGQKQDHRAIYSEARTWKQY